MVKEKRKRKRNKKPQRWGTVFESLHQADSPSSVSRATGLLWDLQQGQDRKRMAKVDATRR